MPEPRTGRFLGGVRETIPRHPARQHAIVHMTTKREERKQRSEAERAFREQSKRAQTMRNRLFFIAGLVIVCAVAFLAVTRRQQSGRVWSAEHGHYHNANGSERR